MKRPILWCVFLCILKLVDQLIYYHEAYKWTATQEKGPSIGLKGKQNGKSKWTSSWNSIACNLLFNLYLAYPISLYHVRNARQRIRARISSREIGWAWTHTHSCTWRTMEIILNELSSITMQFVFVLERVPFILNGAYVHACVCVRLYSLHVYAYQMS